MEEFRSKSYRDAMDGNLGGKMEQTNSLELRSYSINYEGSGMPSYSREEKMKKWKDSRSSSCKGWTFTDPELQRKTRVAGYKVYAVEGKMKGSLKKSVRWVKETYSQVLNGWK